MFCNADLLHPDFPLWSSKDMHRYSFKKELDKRMHVYDETQNYNSVRVSRGLAKPNPFAAKNDLTLLLLRATAPQAKAAPSQVGLLAKKSR